MSDCLATTIDHSTEVTKPCSKCGEVKALEAFHRKSEGRYRRQSQCKECTRGGSLERRMTSIVSGGSEQYVDHIIRRLEGQWTSC